MVKKVVITAAGRGTRFLPMTKILPKELMPIGNKPTLHYLLKECAESGIEQVGIVVRERGNLIEKYFQHNFELEYYLKTNNKLDLLKRIENTNLGMDITMIQQREDLPYGHGRAIYSAKEWVAGDNFGVIFGDDIIKSETPGIKQLISAWEEKPEMKGVVAAFNLPDEDIIKKLGVVTFKEGTENDKVKLLDKFHEKPESKEELLSNHAIIGRALYSGDIFDYLDKLLEVKEEGREFYLWDAMLNMAQDHPYGVLGMDGEWLTTGTQEQMAYTAKRILEE